MDENTVGYWLKVHAKSRDLSDGKLEWCLSGASLIRFCEEVAQAHEEEVAELKGEMGKAQDLVGAAYGLLKRAREEEGDGVD